MTICTRCKSSNVSVAHYRMVGYVDVMACKDCGYVGQVPQAATGYERRSVGEDAREKPK